LEVCRAIGGCWWCLCRRNRPQHYLR
jgi:hypothetical protein